MELHSSLCDLPTAWLFLLSTKMTPECAARFRCTCQLLQKVRLNCCCSAVQIKAPQHMPLLQVVDASWEPEEEVPIAPHRRSVPLTLEQVQAQLPPQEPLPNRSSDYFYSDNFDDDEDNDYDAFGRCKRDVGVYGPALTCLTANQVTNLLQETPMLCWLEADQGTVSKHSTVHQRMQELAQITFSDPGKEWPPEDRRELDCSNSYHGEYFTPAEVQLLRPQRALYCAEQPCLAYAAPGWQHQLLSTTQTSCKVATKEQQQHFLTSTAASDADRFDIHLAFGREESPLYVFLDSTRRRFTGCLKAAHGAAASSAAAEPTAFNAGAPARE